MKKICFLTISLAALITQTSGLLKQEKGSQQLSNGYRRSGFSKSHLKRFHKTHESHADYRSPIQTSTVRLEVTSNKYLTRNELRVENELGAPIAPPEPFAPTEQAPIVLAAPKDQQFQQQSYSPFKSKQLPRLKSAMRQRTQGEALPLNIVENLVMSLHKNNQLSIKDIVRDLHKKLDIIYVMHGGEAARMHLSTTTSTTATPTTKSRKPKPPNMDKEMDKIIENFLRIPKPPTSLESASSVDYNVQNEDDPQMRSYLRQHADEEEDDLEFDLDGTDKRLKVEWRRKNRN